MPRRMRKNAPRRGRRFRKRFHKRKGRKFSKIQSLTVRQPGVVVPDRMFVKHYYLDNLHYQLGTALANVGYYRWRSSAYDPDPLVVAGDISVMGFAELVPLYRYYRTRGMSITAQISNVEAFPVQVVLWPSNADEASLISYAYIQQQLMNAFSRFKVLSPVGGIDKCVMKGYLSTKKFVGTKAVDFDDSYASLNNASPTNMWYWNLACIPLSPGESFTSNPPQFQVRITYYLEWYERNYLTS